MRIRDGLALLGILLLTGCQNVTMNVTPPNLYSGQAIREASDCVPMAFGLSFGEASVESALKQRVIKIGEPYDAHREPIMKLHSIALHDYVFLMFGARCVEVTGE